MSQDETAKMSHGNPAYATGEPDNLQVSAATEAEDAAGEETDETKPQRRSFLDFLASCS